MRSAIGVMVVTWLFIGGMAAGQRGNLAAVTPSCSSLGEISLTVAAGPLNYQGVNPDVTCTLPQPSA